MNRSFRAPESQMQTVGRQRRQVGSLRSPIPKEKEEELALFLDMRKREKERNNLLLDDSRSLERTTGTKPGSHLLFDMSGRKGGADDFLSSDSDKNDYDWLLTPPGTPLFPSLEVESRKSAMTQTGTPKPRPAVLKSRLASPQQEPTTRNNLLSRQISSSGGSNSSSTGTRRPLSSGGPGSRPGTPSRRTASTATSKPSRPATPTSRGTLPSSKAPAPRSSTPVSRSSARSSTPTTRPSIPSSRVPSRAATPTPRLSTPSGSVSVPATAKPSSSVVKSVPTASRNPVPSRGTSPPVKSRPWKPSEMPGFSLDAPPNLRTSLPERPVSASRGRTGVPNARSSIENGPTARPRRQSCSPARTRPPNGSVHGSSVPAVNRVNSKVNDNVSPVMMGAKMVERVINMRKLAPPKQDDRHSPHGNALGKSLSSPDSSGFGRTLSKKSLDMAIRHMDIRRSVPGNLRPLMTNIPASSIYSVRSGSTRSRTVSVSGSPLATSSNASSEMSVSNNVACVDGSEADDDVGRWER